MLYCEVAHSTLHRILLLGSSGGLGVRVIRILPANNTLPSVGCLGYRLVVAAAGKAQVLIRETKINWTRSRDQVILVHEHVLSHDTFGKLRADGHRLRVDINLRRVRLLQVQQEPQLRQLWLVKHGSVEFNPDHDFVTRPHDQALAIVIIIAELLLLHTTVHISTLLVRHLHLFVI